MNDKQTEERREVVLAEEEPIVERQYVEAKPMSLDADQFAIQQQKHAQAMRRVALSTALPCFFDRFGDSPPRMNSKGGNHYRRLFGISTQVLAPAKKEILTDENGEYWIYSVLVRATAIHQPTGIVLTEDATGTCSTRDKFFALRKDANGREYYLPLSEVDKTNVLKKAETNGRIRATEAILGFYPTWEDLAAVFGNKVQAVGKVQYDQSATRAAGKGVITDTKKELWRLISAMAYGKEEAARDLLAEYSAFPVNKGPDKGKIVPGVRSVKDLSDRRAEVTLDKVRKEYAEWKRVEDEAAAEGEGGDA